MGWDSEPAEFEEFQEPTLYKVYRSGIYLPKISSSRVNFPVRENGSRQSAKYAAVFPSGK